jgi:hypothetical protein
MEEIVWLSVWFVLGIGVLSVSDVIRDAVFKK